MFAIDHLKGYPLVAVHSDEKHPSAIVATQKALDQRSGSQVAIAGQAGVAVLATKGDSSVRLANAPLGLNAVWLKIVKF